eukprot:5980742-Amphidinium_carterae.1
MEWFWLTSGQRNHERQRRSNAFLHNVGRIAKISSPASAMALLRIAFQGVRIQGSPTLASRYKGQVVAQRRGATFGWQSSRAALRSFILLVLELLMPC